MARVSRIEKLEPFCNTYDRVYFSDYPSLPAKVKRGSFVKGSVAVFDATVARHTYKGHYFYGRVYTCYELGVEAIEGLEVTIASEIDDWGLR